MESEKVLGVSYFREYTSFRVWSPTACSIKTVIYDNYYDADGKEHLMNRSGDGVWELKLPGDHKNKYYNYKVCMGESERETPDPYAKGASLNGDRGLIVDFQSINPPGWGQHPLPPPMDSTQAIIYEIHIRDFSMDVNSGMINKGKYLAFTEEGTKTFDGLSTGIDHLKELGVTHVHLLPVFDFKSTDERLNKEYNWGYDPFLYNVPEGSYSTNPYEGEVRIAEFKRLIMKLHENNIRVVMDVVYNHTFNIEDSPFQILAPNYYYRIKPNGEYSNGSGCGNEIASEKPMARRFILDSVRFWAEEYKIDGFRFDLMALMDVETMLEIKKQLKAIRPDILIYGEPWTGGETVLGCEQQFRKGCQKEAEIALFNDEFRNAIKGDNDGDGLGFVTGVGGLEYELKKGIAGSIPYSDTIWGFAAQPGESVNYVSSHDNLTLFDKIKRANPWAADWELERMNRLALAMILTSQGIVFIHGGAELLRSKQGNHNSYNAGDDVNKVCWANKTKHLETFNYIRGLISIRKSIKAMTMSKAEDIRKGLRFIDAPPGAAAYLLESACQEDIKYAFVVHNARRDEVVLKLPLPGEWRVIANGIEANIQGIQGFEAGVRDEVLVSPLSTYIMIQ